MTDRLTTQAAPKSVSDQTQDLWTQWRQRVEQSLEQLLPPESEEPSRLHQAMRYSSMGAGKRLRAICAYASARIFSADSSLVDNAACAIEMVHAYSLIHDDLPAMDDDDLRRGKPTCHRAFDEATAILAGDALQSLAFEVIAADTQLPETSRAQLLLTLSRAIGPAGMAGGQALDMMATGKQCSRSELEQIHALKTGALIRASVLMGAQASGAAQAEDLAVLDSFAADLGLAFQIADDILDEEGETDVIGKPGGSDRDSDKSTYVALLGIDGARGEAGRLRDRAVDTVRAQYSDRANDLVQVVQFAVARKY